MAFSWREWHPTSVELMAYRSGLGLEELEEECSRKLLLEIARLCEPWDMLAPGLGLSEAEISSIDYKYGHSDEEKRRAVLERWKETFSFNATCRKLMDAFLSWPCECARGAQEVCRTLNSKNDPENILDKEGLIQFGFHPVTGENIQLSENNMAAQRVYRTYGGGDAVVIGAKRLKPPSKLEVEIISVESKSRGTPVPASLQIGVMQCKSGTQPKKSDLPTRSEFSDNCCVLWKSYVWNNLGSQLKTSKYTSVNLCETKQGDRVGVGLTNEGDLLFFLNGKSHGVAVWNVCRKGYDLYPVVDVANACLAIRITTAVMGIESLQEKCVQAIAGCVISEKSVELLPIPGKLKRRVKECVLPGIKHRAMENGTQKMPVSSFTKPSANSRTVIHPGRLFTQT